MTAAAETLHIPAELAALPRMQAWLARAGDRFELGDATRYALELCCEEAVSNAIRHGFDSAKSPGEIIELKIWRSAGRLHFSMVDHGAAFDPSTPPVLAAPASLEEAKIGGLGVHLLHKFSHAVRYERCEKANHLTLDFLLPPA